MLVEQSATVMKTRLARRERLRFMAPRQGHLKAKGNSEMEDGLEIHSGL